jgi:hypothetical protein
MSTARSPLRRRRLMYFVQVNYDRNLGKNLGRIAYISHREEQLREGRTRPLYGIGERYRALRGDERAIKLAFCRDAEGLRRPVFFRLKLTVDDKAAQRFARFGPTTVERRMRDAADRLFRGVLRDAQGVFGVHQHGGLNRPSHPHVHVQLGPRFQDGTPIHISPERIAKLKLRWEHEVLRELDRQERRFVREPEQLIERLRQREKEREERPHSGRAGGWRAPVWLLQPYRPRRVVPGLDTRLPLALRSRVPGQEIAQNPERVVRRTVLNLAARALPKPFREALELGRTLTRIGR